jgi:hypothetical protein
MDAHHRRIHLIEKIGPQSGHPVFVKLRGLADFRECGCQKPVIHRGNSLRKSASESGPDTASISPTRKAIIRSSASLSHASSKPAGRRERLSSNRSANTARSQSDNRRASFSTITASISYQTKSMAIPAQSPSYPARRIDHPPPRRTRARIRIARVSPRNETFRLVTGVSSWIHIKQARSAVPPSERAPGSVPNNRHSRQFLSPSTQVLWLA